MFLLQSSTSNLSFPSRVSSSATLSNIMCQKVLKQGAQKWQTDRQINRQQTDEPRYWVCLKQTNKQTLMGCNIFVFKVQFFTRAGHFLFTENSFRLIKRLMQRRCGYKWLYQHISHALHVFINFTNYKSPCHLVQFK